MGIELLGDFFTNNMFALMGFRCVSFDVEHTDSKGLKITIAQPYKVVTTMSYPKHIDRRKTPIYVAKIFGREDFQSRYSLDQIIETGEYTLFPDYLRRQPIEELVDILEHDTLNITVSKSDYGEYSYKLEYAKDFEDQTVNYIVGSVRYENEGDTYESSTLTIELVDGFPSLRLRDRIKSALQNWKISHLRRPGMSFYLDYLYENIMVVQDIEFD
jgi:hypothetical protein